MIFKVSGTGSTELVKKSEWAVDTQWSERIQQQGACRSQASAEQTIKALHWQPWGSFVIYLRLSQLKPFFTRKMISRELSLLPLHSKLTAFLWRKWVNESSSSAMSVKRHRAAAALSLRGVLVILWLTELLPFLSFSCAFVSFSSFLICCSYLLWVVSTVRKADTRPFSSFVATS